MRDNYELIEDDERRNSGKIMDAINKKFAQFMFEKQQKGDEQIINSSTQFKKPAFIVDDMKNCFIDMKQSFQYVGDNSTFQKRITTILVVQWIAFSFMVNSMAFFFRSPTFLCRVPLTDIFIHCSESIACHFQDTEYAKVIYENPGFLNTFGQVSINQQFGLICENIGLAPFAQSLFFLGGFLSGYLFSYISSRIGRRSILIIINILSIISICICALAPNFQVFLIGYFLSGFCLFGYETSVYIYIGQISAIRFRTISINMLTMVWAGTPIFLPFLSLIPTWRYAFLFFAFLLLFTLPFAYKCFLESPRFLVTKQCYGQARQIFQKISITNRRPPYKFRLLEEIEAQNKTYLKYQQKQQVEDHSNSIIHKKPKSYNFADLIKYKSIRKVTLILMYWWMFKFFMYFGLNLALQSILRSGLYLTLMISGAAFMEVLGSFGITIMTTFLYKKYKLDIMKTSVLMTTLSCAGMGFLQIGLQCKVQFGLDGQFCFELVLMILFVLVIKFFNTVFFSGLISYSSEVYPTPVRSLGCGFTLTFGRLGTILVPYYINYMKFQYPTKNSLCFITPFGVIAYFLCCMMPYTEKDGMKDELQQEQETKLIQLQNLK